jgi:hypothetical protein
MPSSLQILLSIWPRLDAAAVWTSALWPSRFMVSVMPSAVSGLTNHDAPSAAVVPAGSGWQSRAFSSRYCEYIEPPTADTVLPSSACASSEEPALITVPAPSLPTGMAWSSRAARKGRAAWETLAFTTVLSPLPEEVAADMSAGPTSRPRSDGFIGVASTLTTTWSGPGSGTSTLASDSSSSPLLLIRERSCRPVVVLALIVGLLFFRDFAAGGQCDRVASSGARSGETMNGGDMIVRRVAVGLVLGALAVLPSAGPAHAWGATGHEFISGIAAELFPEEIPAFLRTPEAVATIAVFGREPDRDKHTGDPHDGDLNPMHYVKLSDDGAVDGILPLDKLPVTIDAYDAALRAGGSSPYKAGYLPYAIVVGWQQLAKDFAYWRASSIGAKTALDPADRAWFDRDRQRRELLLLRDLGYWSHFPGDASMPLHDSVHFYGWGPYPNPQGYSTEEAMELFIKGTFVRRNIKRDAVKAGVPPYRACTCTIWDRARTLILASHTMVVPIYELEKRGEFKKGGDEAVALVTAQLAVGAAAVRDMVIDAWAASGDMMVGDPAVSMRDILSGKHILKRDDFHYD